MPRNATINYQRLTINTVRTKFLSFLLGMFVFLIVISTISIFLLTRYLFLFTRKITKVNDKSNVLSKITEQKTYVVQEGDDLWNISEKIFGSGYNYYDIARANNLVDPYVLSAGQILKIPDVTPQPPTQGETSSTSTSQVTFMGKSYTVKFGDDLGKIALRAYGDPEAWKRIAEANKLANPNDIHEGNVLIIPR